MSTMDSPKHETWDTRWSDFSIVVATGEELRCHKVLLAKCSPFFDAMLSSNMEETKNSKMEAKEFSLETVRTFLEFVYANSYAFESYGEDFDEEQITPQLIRLCHLYGVESLFNVAQDYLSANIDDSNAVAIWFEAQEIENEYLKECALNYMASAKKEISELDDIDRAYKSPELMKALVDRLMEVSDEMTCKCQDDADDQPIDDYFGLPSFAYLSDFVTCELCKLLRAKTENLLEIHG